MIQNALTKAKHGGRLSFTRRLPLVAPLISRTALKPIHYAASKLNLPPRTRTFSQSSFQTTGHTSLDHEYDTIYALSTAPGRAAIAIIRISGAGWWDVSSASVLQLHNANGIFRYTKHYAPIDLPPHLERRLYETSWIRPTRTTSSTQLSSSTSLPQKL